MAKVSQVNAGTGGVAIYPPQRKAQLTFSFLQRYAIHEPFACEFGTFFNAHRDALSIIHDWTPESVAFSTATGTSKYYGESSCMWIPTSTTTQYATDMDVFLQRWKLDRLDGYRGYQAVHDALMNAHSGIAGTCLGSTVLYDGDHYPSVGEATKRARVLTDNEGRHFAREMTSRKPLMRVEINAEWRATHESRHAVYERLLAVCAQEINAELDRVAAMYIESGFIFSDTESAMERDLDWTFRRFVLGDDEVQIGDSTVPKAPARTIQNRTNALAKKIGLSPIRIRTRTV